MHGINELRRLTLFSIAAAFTASPALASNTPWQSNTVGGGTELGVLAYTGSPSSAMGVTHEANVSAVGDATREYPIALPSSLLCPSIGVRYASSRRSMGAESPGLGWDLYGIPWISSPTEPQYVGTDTYRLDGTTLLFHEAGMGADEYLGKQAVTNTKILARRDTQANAWEVHEDGRRTTFESVGIAGMWRATKIEDQDGNLVELTYGPTGVLMKLDCGANVTVAGGAHDIRVTFTYDSLGAGTIRQKRYVASAYTMYASRLSEVLVERKGASGVWRKLRRYIYVASTFMPLGPETPSGLCAAQPGDDRCGSAQLLKRIRVEGTGTETRNVGRFGYQTFDDSGRYAMTGDLPAPEVASRTRKSYFTGLAATHTKLDRVRVDINGDGILDVVSGGNTGYLVRTTATFDEIQPASNSWCVWFGKMNPSYTTPHAPFYDTNCLPLAGPWAGAHETAHYADDQQYEPPILSDYTVTLSKLVDVDGDGLVDVMVADIYDDGQSAFKVYYNQGGDGVTAPLFGPPIAEPVGGVDLNDTHMGFVRTYLEATKIAAASGSSNDTDRPLDVQVLADIDDDGRKDIVTYENGVGGYWRKLPGRGTGYAVQRTPLQLPSLGNVPQALSNVTYAKALDPIALMAFQPCLAAGMPVLDQIGHLYTHSFQDIGLVDLNGDGRLDYVDARSPLGWMVYFGTAPGAFATVGEAWSAPATSLRVAAEASPHSLVRMMEVDTFPQLNQCDLSTPPVVAVHEGYGGAVLRGLLDVDGDGLEDYVIADVGYYRNLGSGFDTLARDLPAYFPSGGLSRTATPFLEILPPMIPSVYTLEYDWVARQTTRTSQAVADVDGDGRFDFIGEMDGPAVVGMTLGATTIPYRLVEVRNEAGGKTLLDYTSTSHVYPAGGHHNGFTGVHACAAQKSVVDESTTTDALRPGYEVRTDYRYENPSFARGLFHGFLRRESWTYATDSQRSDDPIRRLRIDYDLSEVDLGPLVQEVTSFTDGNRCDVPALADAACPAKRWIEASKSSYLRTTVGAYDEYRPVSVVATTISGEGSSTVPATPVTSFTSYSYDPANGDLTAITFQPAEFPALPIRQTSFTYARDALDTIKRASSVRVNDGTNVLAFTERTYDGAAFGVLTLGHPTEVRRCLSPQFPTVGSCAELEIVGATYTARGQVGTVTDRTVAGGSPLNVSITRAYGGNGTLVTSVTNDLGHANVVDYDDYGRPSTWTTPDGVTRRRTYTTFGEITEESIRANDGGAFLPQRAFSYSFSTVPRYATIDTYGDDGNVEHQSVLELDGFGRPRREWSEQQTTGAALYFRRDYDRSMYGGLLRTSHLGAGHGVVDTSLPLDFSSVEHLAYLDGRGAPREVYTDYANLPSSVVVVAQPQTWESEIVDASGYVKRLVSSTYGLEEVHGRRSAGPEQLLAQYERDALGRVTRIDVPNGDFFSYQYDTANRLRQSRKGNSHNPAGNVFFTYTFDGNRPYETTDGTAYAWQRYVAFDAIGRPTEMRSFDPLLPNNEAVTRIEYDTVLPGRISSVFDPWGRPGDQLGESYAYDRFGRVASVTRHWHDGTPPTTYSGITHDRIGRPTAWTYPSGNAVEHFYDDGFRFQSKFTHVAQAGGASFFVARTQDPLTGTAKSVSVSDPTIAVLSRSFVRGVSPKEVSHDAFTLGPIQVERSYTYEPNGMLSTVAYDENGPTPTSLGYGYDDLARLETFQVDDGTSVLSHLALGYDNAFGDIASIDSAVSGTKTFRYPAITSGAAKKGLRAPNQRTGGGVSETLSFDNAGRVTRFKNVTSGDEWLYTYDGYGRLRSAELGVPSTERQEYRYDATGALLETVQTAGGATWTVKRWMTWRREDDGVSTKQYETFGGLLRTDVSNPSSHARIWQYRELHDGSVSLRLDGGGNVLGAQLLNPLGEHVSVPSLGYATDDSFHGAESIEASSAGGRLFAMGRRSLLQGMGMWLQPEPLLADPRAIDLLSPQRMNPYRYAGNDPANFADPSGLDPEYIEVDGETVENVVVDCNCSTVGTTDYGEPILEATVYDVDIVGGEVQHRPRTEPQPFEEVNPDPTTPGFWERPWWWQDPDLIPERGGTPAEAFWNRIENKRLYYEWDFDPTIEPVDRIPLTPADWDLPDIVWPEPPDDRPDESLPEDYYALSDLARDAVSSALTAIGAAIGIGAAGSSVQPWSAGGPVQHLGGRGGHFGPDFGRLESGNTWGPGDVRGGGGGGGAARPDNSPTAY